MVSEFEQRSSSLYGVHLRGIEAQLPALEDVGNYLRDLVFLHDRLVLSQLRPRAGAEAYSFSFYSRYQRRELRESRPRLKSVVLGSPFELIVLLPAMLVAPRAVMAFTGLIRQLALVGPERALLQARAAVTREEAERRHVENGMLSRVASYIEDDPERLLLSDRAMQLVMRDASRLAKGPIYLDGVEEITSPENDDGALA